MSRPERMPGSRAVVALIVAALGLVLALSACGTEGEAKSSKDGQTTGESGNAGGAKDGEKSEKGEEPENGDEQRIVPLNGDIAEVVWALGLGDRVVGVDTSATYPEEAAAFPDKIGYARQLSAEGVLSLAPTIAIGTEDAGPPEVIDQIREAGVEVVIVDTPHAPDEVDDKIEAVADALGVPEKGTEVADEAMRRIEQAEATLADVGPAGDDERPRVAFVYARGPDTLMLAGVGSKADGMIEAAGAIDAGTEAGVEGFVQLTPEALADAQPDVLLMLSSGLESLGGVDGLMEVPGVEQTPAAESGRILDYDGQLLLGLGPRTGEVLEQLIQDLYVEPNG